MGSELFSKRSSKRSLISEILHLLLFIICTFSALLHKIMQHDVTKVPKTAISEPFYKNLMRNLDLAVIFL